MFKIEKNVPVVPLLGNRGKYPFRDMDVGDSFLVPADEAKFSKHSHDGRPVNRIAVAASWAGKRYGRKFTARTLEDKSVRVWRIA